MNYRWSSLPGYLHKANEQKFIEYSTVLDQHGGETRSARQYYKRQISEDLIAGAEIRDKIVGHKHPWQ